MDMDIDIDLYQIVVGRLDIDTDIDTGIDIEI